MRSFRVVVLMLSTALIPAGCGGSPGRVRGSDLTVSWEVLRNLSGDQGARFEAEMSLTNQGPGRLPADGWSLYFNTLAAIEPLQTPESIKIDRINGGFHRLTPTSGFKGLGPGESADWQITFPGWSVSRSDAPTGFYLVYQDGSGEELEPQPLPPPFVRPFVTAAQTRRGPGDRVPVPTPESRFEANEELTLLPAGEFGMILPTPANSRLRPGEWTLDAEVEIRHGAGLTFEAEYLATALQPLLGRKPPVGSGTQPGAGRIVLRIGAVDSAPAGSAEAYRLTVSPDNGVEIVGPAAAGVFYGVQSLRALLPRQAYAGLQTPPALPAVEVTDVPRFSYRGFHLDVARNFQPKRQVLKLLDLMSIYKLNKFHFHLSDDEGWRFQVEGLPELTEVGARRGHTSDESDRLAPSYGSGPFPDSGLSSGTGFYSRGDMIEILRYAHQRHIEVIPEIDVPGHARAAIVSMEARAARLQAESARAADEYRLVDPNDQSQYRSIQGWRDNVVDVCRESTYRFLGKVFDELIEVYGEAGVPLRVIHTGGDEVPHGVWEESPACRELPAAGAEGVDDVHELPRYFVRRLSTMLGERGLVTGGWEEIALTESGPEERRVKLPDPEFTDDDLLVYVWNSIWGEPGAENAYRLANAGYDVVLCNASNLYFDLAYNKDPEELGQAWAGYVNTRKPYEFAPFDIYKSARQDYFGNPIDPETLQSATGLNSTGQAHIRGIQGQLWSEVLTSTSKMEYMAFPKLLALAERAWAPRPDWARVEDREESDRLLTLAWNRFANRLGQRELPRLDYLHGGVHYRLPLPGAVIENGRLHANVAFPGLPIRYTTDGTEPTADSPLYTGPVDVSGVVMLKTFDTRGRGSRTSAVR